MLDDIKDIEENDIKLTEEKSTKLDRKRSKREDLICVLQDEIIARHELQNEIVKAQLRCGALNPMET